MSDRDDILSLVEHAREELVVLRAQLMERIENCDRLLARVDQIKAQAQAGLVSEAFGSVKDMAETLRRWS